MPLGSAQFGETSVPYFRQIWFYAFGCSKLNAYISLEYMKHVNAQIIFPLINEAHTDCDNDSASTSLRRWPTWIRLGWVHCLRREDSQHDCQKSE
jgi:hypothetical protein